VLSLHWGVHFVPRLIADYQKTVVQAAFAAGADLILGHHAHVPNPSSAPASKKRRYLSGLAPAWRFRHHRELWGGVGLGGVREFLEDRRIAEFRLLRSFHPISSARLASALHPIGAAFLVAFGAPGIIAFALLHGAGNGMITIAKGTLPLALFGPGGYGLRSGLLSAPARMLQAAAPFLFGLLLDRVGLGAVGLSAGLCLAAFASLFLQRPRRAVAVHPLPVRSLGANRRTTLLSRDSLLPR
jgi:hypothetical protein